MLNNRHLNTSDYRYGFQNQEMDDEIKGEGNSLNYTFRMHDPRAGRFFAVDPLSGKYPWYSPYQFSGNRVLDRVELEGLEPSTLLTGYLLETFSSAVEKTTKEHPEASCEEQATGILRNYTIDVVTDIAGFTDIDDATIIVTTLLPGEEGPININGERATTFNKVLAFGGILIPFVSGSTVGEIIKVTGDLANGKHIAKGLDPPFDAMKNIYEAVLKTDEKFVRVYSSDLGNITGDFLVKADEIKGLSPSQIKDRLALDYVPDRIVDVNVPAGTTIRSGVVAERKSVNALGGGNQVQIQGKIDKSNFTNARELKE